MNAILKGHLESVRDLLSSASEYINKLEIFPRRRGVFVDAVVLAILSKCIRVGYAVCLLVEDGFDSEAFGLSRTVLELALYNRYVSNGDSFQRSGRFVHYFAKDHEGWTNVVTKYYPTRIPKFREDHDRMMELAKQIKDAHRWSGKSVRALAMEEDVFDVMPDGSPLKWEFDYEAIYKLSSHYVHGSVVAVDEHAMAPGQPFKVNSDPRSRLGDTALFNVAMYLHKSFVAAFRCMNYDMSEAMNGKFDEVIKQLIAER